MVRKQVLFVIVAAASIGAAGDNLAGAEKIPAQPVGGEIRWVYDYQAGKDEARQTGKPIFVVIRCER